MKEEKYNCINSNQTKTHIEKYGFSIVMIESTNYLPSFTYSIGLPETCNHPKIICFGIPPQFLHKVMYNIIDSLKKKGALSSNNLYNTIFKNSIAKFLQINSKAIKSYCSLAIKYFGFKKFEVSQLICPNKTLFNSKYNQVQTVWRY